MAKKINKSAGSDIKVNTTAVRTAMNTLTSLNNSMEKDFDAVKRAMSKLDSSWDGSASSKAISKFNSIKSNYCGSNGRKAVMNTYVKFLSGTVAADYETTEGVNTNLANLFK